MYIALRNENDRAACEHVAVRVSAFSALNTPCEWVKVNHYYQDKVVQSEILSKM